MNIKRSYFIAIPLVLLFGIALVMSFQSTFNRFNMIVKHTAFFLFFALFVFGIIKVMYKILLRREKLKSYKAQLWLKVFTVFVFGGFLFTLSKIQLNYIDKYETPDLLVCSYYDDYGNKLYDSYFYLSCPIFEVVSQDDDAFHLRGYEDVEGHNVTYYADEMRVNGGSISSEIIVDITVAYDDLGRIDIYQLKWTQSSVIETETGVHNGYISLMKEVTNTYSEFELISDQRNYQYEEMYQGIVDTSLSGHYDFSDASYLQNKYIVEYGEEVTITNEYIDRNKEQGIRLIGEGSVSSELINADFHTDTLYTDEVFLDTILTNSSSGMKHYTLMQPTYGALVYTNEYKDMDGLAVISNKQRNSAYGDYNWVFDSYKETSNGHTILEGLVNLYKLVETEYGYRLETYDYGYHSYDYLYESYTSYLRVSPSSYFHVFDYLDYVNLLFDSSKMNEHILYPYNPILDHVTYYED